MTDIKGAFISQEVAETYLGLSRSSLLRARNSGELTFYQFSGSIRYRLEDLEAYAERHRRGPKCQRSDSATTGASRRGRS